MRWKRKWKKPLKKSPLYYCNSRHHHFKVAYLSASNPHRHVDYLIGEFGLSATLTNPVYLSKITTPLDSIRFLSSLADNQLSVENEEDIYEREEYVEAYLRFWNYRDIGNAVLVGRFPRKYNQILIHSKRDNKENSRISFNYTNSTAERLKLLSVKFYGYGIGTQVSNGEYKFSYNENKLPPYLSLKTDHLGYYNGIKDPYSSSNPDSSINPAYRIALYDGEDLFYATKEPNPLFTQHELLTKIVYPTGGYTIFEFEQHDYTKIAKKWPFVVENKGQNEITCGVRIKRINFYDKNDSLSHYKEYSYVDSAGLSSGVLSYQPYYFEEIDGYLTRPRSRFDSLSTRIGQYTKLWRFSSKALNPMTHFDGSHVTYSRVVERDGGNGSNIYVFSNYDNGYHDLPALSYVSDHSEIKDFITEFPGISRKNERGLLLKQIVLNEANDTLRSVSNSYFDYSAYLDFQAANPLNEDGFIRMIKKGANSIYHEFNLTSYTIASYKMLCYYPYLRETLVKNYFADHVVQNTKQFQYDRYHNLTRVQTSSSKSDIVTDSLLYAYHFDQDSVYAKMVTDHQLAPIIGQKRYIGLVLSFEKLNEYAVFGVKARLKKEKDRYYADDSFREGVVINHYDDYGNPVEIEYPDGSRTCYLWGYQGQYPVAVIKNIDYNSIKNSISYATLQSLDLDKGSLEFSLFGLSIYPQVQYEYYTYVPSVGVSSHTDSKGLSTYYMYDENNRLKVVKDHDGHILKTYCYGYSGVLIDCDTEIPLDLTQFTAGYGGTTLSQALSYSTDPGPFDPLMHVETVFSGSGSFLTNLLGPPNDGFYADIFGASYILDGFYTDFSLVNPTTYRWFQIENGQIIWSNSLFL